MKLFDQNGKLDSDVQDALYELGNVGLGMASVTIGKILGVRVELSVPVVVPVGEVLEQKLLMDGNKDVFMLMRMQEPLKGSVLFDMNQEFVRDVIEQLTGTAFSIENLEKDEVGFSALTEFANMLASAYMKAIGKYTGLRIFMSSYFAVLKQEQASLDKIMQAQGTLADRAIWIETSFALVNEEGEKTSDFGRVIMLPDDETVKALLQAMGLD